MTAPAKRLNEGIPDSFYKAAGRMAVSPLQILLQ